MSTLSNRRQSRYNFFEHIYANDEPKRPKVRKMHDIKLAFSEFYLSLILIQNYQTLNFTGFRKILKKHDKVCNLL